MKSLTNFIFTAMAFTILTGCSTVTAPTGTGAVFTPSTPPAGQAQVFHYRMGGKLGSGLSFYMFFDENLAGEIGNGGYIKQVVTPGTHDYEALQMEKIDMAIPLLYRPLRDWSNSREKVKPVMSITIKPGETQYYRWEKRVRWNADPIVTRVPEHEALPEISQLREFPPVEEVKRK